MGLVFIFLLLEFLSAPAVVLKGSLPKQFLLRNSSTFLPMNRLKESSLSSLDVQVPILQRSYELDPITAFIPLSVAVSLANISYTNSFGILFGHRVKKSDGIDIHVEGVCEFEYPLSRHQLDSQINKSISYLSRVTSLEPVGCLFPNRSAGVSGWEILAGLALSRFSRHPEEFIFVR